MTDRPKAHVNETIACRTFESCLDPMWVVQPTFQGRDYGTDYTITIFDSRGKYKSKIEAQIKYVQSTGKVSDQIRTFFGWYKLRITDELPEIKIVLSVNKIRAYQSNPFSLLLVGANEDDIYYMWFSDYYEYFLKWLPGKDGVGSMSVYINGLRSNIVKYTSSDFELFERPWKKNRTRSKHVDVTKIETLIPHFVSGEERRWISNWCQPNTIDAQLNMGFTAYFYALRNKNIVFNEFNSQGFWELLKSKSKSNPFIFALFSNFIGEISPTIEMVNWAKKVLADWKEIENIGPAFQIIGNCQSTAEISPEIEKFATNPVRDFYWNLVQINSELKVDAIFDRIVLEIFLGYANFLSKCVESRRLRNAQEVLFDRFYNFDYSLPHPNIFGYFFANLSAKSKLFKNSESFKIVDNLLRNKYAGKPFHEAFPQINRDWAREYIESK